MRTLFCVTLAGVLLAAGFAAEARAEDKAVIKVGIIGLDTSHVPAFTKLLNNPEATGDLAGFRVVAGFPGGSDDVKSSYSRVKGFTKDLQDMGVEIVPSIDALLPKVDVVLLESVDGRPHLAQVRPVLKAKKRVFIDKPVGGTLADVIEIYRLAKELNVPCFSASSLRFSPDIQKICHDKKIGDIMGCDARGPCHLEPHHPDLFWYGIHGVETLFTIMGPGCDSVTRVHTDTTEVAVGVWKDGRVGTYRGMHDSGAGHQYGAHVWGSKDIVESGDADPYDPLVVEIAKFFKTGVVPVSPEETIEIYAFMEAADESKRQGGCPVKIETVMAKARAASGSK